jgi:hypothetical protein
MRNIRLGNENGFQGVFHLLLQFDVSRRVTILIFGITVFKVRAHQDGLSFILCPLSQADAGLSLIDALRRPDYAEREAEPAWSGVARSIQIV